MIFSLDNKTTAQYDAIRMTGKKPVKQGTSLRTTVGDLKLIEVLQAKTGLNTTGVIRLALRRLAEAEGIKVA